MGRLSLCPLIVGVALWIGVGPRASAAPVDCAKPVAACTACHSPRLAQNYANCATRPWTVPPQAKELHSQLAASPKAIAEGKANYGIFCEACHGPKADGAGPIAVKFGIPAADLRASQVRQESDGELYWKLSRGWGAMPNWSDVLSDNDRWEVIAFIRSLETSH